MKTRSEIARQAAQFCLAAAVLLPAASHAQGATDTWQWRATLYGWFPSISGSTSFPPTGASGPSFNVNADSLIDALKFAMMGTLEVQKGKWGLWTDVMYADLGGDKSGTRELTVGNQALPVGVTANLSLDVKSWLWTIAGTYNIMKSPEHSMDLLLGARMVDVDQTLNYAFTGNIGSLGLPGPSGSKTLTMTNWDAIIGIKGMVSISDDRKWFVPYYLDIGTGQSQFTWQGFLGVGYAFSKSGAASLGWRYLDYEMDSGDPIQSLNFSGAFLGLSFGW